MLPACFSFYSTTLKLKYLMKKELIFSAALVMGMLSSCDTENTANIESLAQGRVEVQEPEPSYAVLPLTPKGSKAGTVSSKAGALTYKVFMAEYLTSGESEQMGRTVFFDDRGNKQLQGDFVPALSLDGTPDISYYVDNNRPSVELAAGTSEAAIDRAMATWNRVQCSDLGMTKVPYDGRATGLVVGSSFAYVADVVHAGWLPAAFFDTLAEGGSGFILGVTFTIVFLDQDGNLVDTDNNGKYDVAWREIYYNDNFQWNDGSTYDVETIALHEAGHGLSQAHFGSAFLSGGNGILHFSPRAVMNAAYSGVQTGITQTDNSGHCSNWSAWPNN